MARLILRREQRGLDEGLPATALVGSLGLHATVVVLAIWGATRIAVPSPRTVYQVELVAAPRSAPVRQVPTPVVARPEPELEEEVRTIPAQPEPVPEAQEEPTARADRKPAPETAEREDRSEEERPPSAPPTPTEEGAEDLAVRLEGAPFPYPEYLENIIVQIKRHWRPPSGGRQLRAELAFTILEDGSVEDIRWTRRSGDPSFDLQARGAIETAGRRRAFGPLPEEYPGDRLRVSFFFDPSRY